MFCESNIGNHVQDALGAKTRRAGAERFLFKRTFSYWLRTDGRDGHRNNSTARKINAANHKAAETACGATLGLTFDMVALWQTVHYQRMYHG